MKPSLLVLAPALLTLAACSGEATPSNEADVHAAEPGAPEAPVASNDSERALEDYLGGMNEIVSALEKVEDKTSADAAGATIDKVSADWEQAKAGWMALDETDVAVAQERYADELGRVQGEMMIALTKLMSKPELVGPIQEAIGNLPKFDR